MSSSWSPGSNIATPFLHPGHSLPVPKGGSIGLVAATESVRAEIGRGREDIGLLAVQRTQIHLAGAPDTGLLLTGRQKQGKDKDE